MTANYLQGIATRLEQKSMRLTRKEARDRINEDWAGWWIKRAITKHRKLFWNALFLYGLDVCMDCRVVFLKCCPECGQD